MREPIRLGGFILETPLSSGGMGTVWRARHELTGIPAAVKVIAGTHARDPMYLDGFEREVAAIAKLQHPRIVRVFDFGFVDSAAEKSSAGDLPRRSPWLAMEFATHGSLAQLPGVRDWDTLKTILFDILDALAHSHARGIIHRDLKPGNILLADSDDGVHCKLTDFGISHVAGRSASTREVFASAAGTPWYMAPEQVDARWRDYGPWTDLYALGCVAYQLASGRTPFVGDSAVRVARQQLFDRPEPLAPMFRTPPSFAAWVERLLVKEIPHRFRRAADAAWALHLISPRTENPIHLATPPPILASSEVETTQVPATESMETGVATLTFLSGDTAALPPPPAVPQFVVPGALLAFSHPPVPQDWRTRADRDDNVLPVSGLGLYQLREAPLVGRETERDHIWSALREAVTARRVRAVVVRGGPGSGKSRLALWASQRAHELGAASSMFAQHSPIGGAAHGIGAMFSRYLGCSGLDFERSYLRIRRLVTSETTEPPESIAYFAAGLARFIHPGGEAQGVPAVRFTSAEERYQVIRRLSATIAGRRPFICILDDVQWGYDALEYAVRLLDLEHPILLIICVRPDQLAGRPLEAETLRELEQHPATSTLELGPLSRREHATLVDRLLVLEPTLREEVLERTDGAPMFATELVGDWVRRRVLRASPHGFRLDTIEEIPTDLHALWNRRVDRALSLMTDTHAARVALEVGATLGTSVSDAEWREACAQLHIEIEDGLIDALAGTGIVDKTETGWMFQHQMLRESIADGATASGRSAQQHRVIAELLRFDESPDGQLRRALHCLAFDDAVEAAQPLLSAFESMVWSGRAREASAVLSMLNSVFDRIPADHRLHRRVYEARLLLLMRQGGRPDAILDFVEQVRPIARNHGWQSTLAELARAQAAVSLERGELQRGRDLLREAIDHARLSRTPATLARTHLTLGWVAVRLGDLDDGRAHFETARDHFQMASQTDGISEAISGLAEIEYAAGNFAAARRYNDEAIRLCRFGGFRVLLSTGLNQRGDIASSEGDFRAALRFYAEALETALLTDDHASIRVVTLNVGLTLVAVGRYAEAREKLQEARALLTRNDLIVYSFIAEVGLLWCAAAAADTEAWDAAIAGVLARASQDVAERDSARAATRAAAAWVAAGDAARAMEALQLARALVPAGYAADYSADLDAHYAAASALHARITP